MFLNLQGWWCPSFQGSLWNSCWQAKTANSTGPCHRWFPTNITTYHHWSGVIFHTHLKLPLHLGIITLIYPYQPWFQWEQRGPRPGYHWPGWRHAQLLLLLRPKRPIGHLGMPVAGDPGTGHGFSAGLNTHGFPRSCQRNEIREAVQSPGLGFDRRWSKYHVPIHHLWWVHQIRRTSRPCGK